MKDKHLLPTHYPSENSSKNTLCSYLSLCASFLANIFFCIPKDWLCGCFSRSKKNESDVTSQRLAQTVIHRMEILGQNIGLANFKMLRDLSTMIDTEIMGTLTDIMTLVDGNDDSDNDLNPLSEEYQLIGRFIRQALKITKSLTEEELRERLTQYFKQRPDLTQQFQKGSNEINDEEKLGFYTEELSPLEIDKAVFSIQSVFVSYVEPEIYEKVKLEMENQFHKRINNNIEPLRKMLFDLLPNLVMLQSCAVVSTPTLILDERSIGEGKNIDTNLLKGVFSGEKKLKRNQNKKCFIFIPTLYQKNNNSIISVGLCEIQR